MTIVMMIYSDDSRKENNKQMEATLIHALKLQPAGVAVDARRFGGSRTLKWHADGR